VSESDYIPKQLIKDTYETTPEFNKRVTLEKQRVTLAYKEAQKSVNVSYQEAMKHYNKQLSTEKRNLKNAKRTLPYVLKETLKDALNYYLGKPYIESFKNYNADDGAYYTKIMSSKFAMDVAIVVPLSEAKALHTSGKLKELKPEVMFEYNNGSLYISNVVVKDKNKNYKVNLLDLSNYDKTFILGRDVRATFVVWSDKPLKDKSIEKNIEKIKLLAVAKEKERVRKLQLAQRPFMKRLVKGERSYTKVTENSVKDNLQGIIWQKSGSTNSMSWSEAKEYCSSLEQDGSSEWRLPTFKELYYLIDRSKLNKSQYEPAIDTKYFKADCTWYWSSTEYKNDISNAWYAYFGHGLDYYHNKSSEKSVRCVLNNKK